MEWALILIMALPGQPVPPPVQAGVMRDEATCIVAGGGMAIVLSRANPGLVVGFRCEPVAEAGA
jgi:hypothetical protein